MMSAEKGPLDDFDLNRSWPSSTNAECTWKIGRSASKKKYSIATNN